VRREDVVVRAVDEVDDEDVRGAFGASGLRNRETQFEHLVQVTTPIHRRSLSFH
jgi:hypothetical protein